MKKPSLSLIHIILAILTLIIVTSKLNSQGMPEMIPYRIVPLDYVPDNRLELGVELIHPYRIENLVEVHRQETIEIIYERIAFEMVNPDHINEIFKIDGKLYYLIRIPYTGTIWNEDM